MLLRCLVLLLCAGGCLPVLADWRDSAGYTALQAEMGASLPTGAGISVMISEASTTAYPLNTYLLEGTSGTAAFSGTGAFAGKTITPHSGASTTSAHAQAVAAMFIGNTGSLAPDVTEIHAWLADDFLGELYYNDPPATFAGSVQNHSWAGSTNDSALDTELLRRLDFMIARDGPTVITPMNNGAGMAALQANAYHSLSVGLLSGAHPHTQTTLDTTGRMKPDLVVDQPYTSYAGPCVSSAAVLLLDLIRPAYPDADDPRVLKALLIAGASKANLPGWKRTATSKPYDATYGAGELNVLHPVRILQAGRQLADNGVLRNTKGWDIGTASPASAQRYFFTVPAGRWANTFSAALTWHRTLNADYTTSTLNDLNLRLARATGFTPGTTVDESVSTVDNVEHLFLRNLPAGDYVLEVSTTSGSDTYGLAWEADLGGGPQVVLQRSAGTSALTLGTLDPFVSYTVDRSPDLQTWTPVITLRTADSTPATTAAWSEAATGARLFYRLRW